MSSPGTDRVSWTKVLGAVIGTVVVLVGVLEGYFLMRDIQGELERLDGDDVDLRAEVDALDAALASAIDDAREARAGLDRELEAFAAARQQALDDVVRHADRYRRELGDEARAAVDRIVEDLMADLGATQAVEASVRDDVAVLEARIERTAEELEGQRRSAEAALAEAEARFIALEELYSRYEIQSLSPAALDRYSFFTAAGTAGFYDGQETEVELRDGRRVRIPAWRRWGEPAPASLGDLERAGVLRDFEIFLAVAAGRNADHNGRNDRGVPLDLSLPEPELRALFDDFRRLAPLWSRQGYLSD